MYRFWFPNSHLEKDLCISDISKPCKLLLKSDIVIISMTNNVIEPI